MSNVSFTDDQFRDLIGVLASRNFAPLSPSKPGSFALCTAHFDGTRDAALVEAFLSTITTFKKIEFVSDSNAIEGLTLLLTGEASIWWLGVKDDITSWSEAITLLRTTFAPKRPAYKIYEEIVCIKQSQPRGTELFVAKKRALMAELPKPALTVSQCLDLLYASLHVDIRDKIPRDSVSSFDEFLRKARQIEEVLIEQKNTVPSTSSGKRIRCTFCRVFGHSEENCRKKETYTEKTQDSASAAVPYKSITPT
ncbi:activity-regulated cytoskeleton associated protein 2-like [Ostrinia furnacalis]|uniref:activity-regulated cytoskeleton associated protein 2-like n=1 Tax=Ostrinia furnacalis TaxID=93504 RepID=UPI0010394755|nr:activity-regulated cytoskeleton associated protein 2-like [Ostrinia furnacalis]